MPTHEGLPTTEERKLSEAERGVVRDFLALLNARELERLGHLIPLVINEPGWWLRDELTTLSAKQRTAAAAAPKKD